MQSTELWMHAQKKKKVQNYEKIVDNILRTSKSWHFQSFNIWHFSNYIKNIVDVRDNDD